MFRWKFARSSGFKAVRLIRRSGGMSSTGATIITDERRLLSRILNSRAREVSVKGNRAGKEPPAVANPVLARTVETGIRSVAKTPSRPRVS